MAICHISFQIISRSKGRSATATAAYRAGAKIVDERTGETYDFSHRKDVAAATILAPDNTPEWVKNRSTLWNEVEKFERRKDAQVCRELNVALPIELSSRENAVLLNRYIRSCFVSKGMVADVCMHNMEGHNPHAHIMLSLRSIDSNGFGKKVREWNSKDQLQEWRKQWATHTNSALKTAGHIEQIDHRSLKQQGINRKPTTHRGPYLNTLIKEFRAITARIKKLKIVGKQHRKNISISNINRPSF